MFLLEEEAVMAEAHVVGALRKKRAELFGRIIGLEKELRQQRADMKHVDATLRLFAPSQSLSKPSARPSWLRRGEGSRLVLSILRDADKPLTAGEITERLLAGKPASAATAGARDALCKTVLAALSNGRNKGIIRRSGCRGATATWQIAQ
jgi:hypothetical protein